MTDKKLIQEKMIAKWREEIRDNGVDERMDSFYYRCEAFMLSWSDKIAEEARRQERERCLEEVRKERTIFLSNKSIVFLNRLLAIRKRMRDEIEKAILTDQKENKEGGEK